MNSAASARLLKYAMCMDMPSIASIVRANSHGIDQMLNAALDMFDGDEKKAFTWLTSPCYSLGGMSPVSYGESSEGVNQVLDFIDGLVHGNFA